MGPKRIPWCSDCEREDETCNWCDICSRMVCIDCDPLHSCLSDMLNPEEREVEEYEESIKTDDDFSSLFKKKSKNKD